MKSSSKKEEKDYVALLKVFEQRLLESAEMEEELDVEARQQMLSARRISRISHVAAILIIPTMLALILSLVYSTGSVTQEMGNMSHMMSNMRSDFDRLSQVMARMDVATNQMSNNIAAVPTLKYQVSVIDDNFGGMVNSMKRISPSVGNISTHLTGLDSNLSHMNNVFSHLNGSVHHMGHDVNKISNPMQMMPNFFGR